ncbi:hypothetical protein KXS07_00730 [Inquilinus limosus]|uniref:hypothetical protein n=1 Tax=Inquilinus limosus TaxID=171674 RepID=UPI003F16F100
MRWPSYLWRAFNARPFGMPVPPAWFAILASGLLGAFIDPAFYLIGGGLTAAVAGMVASSPRFRRTVDAADLPPAEDDRDAVLARLDDKGRARQADLEEQCRALQHVLESAGAGGEHIRGTWQLVRLHLQLLAARQAAASVIETTARDQGTRLSRQIDDIERRLAQPEIDHELREALEGQAAVLRNRLAMRGEAERRLEVLDAELERIRQQIALIREQALLASDASGIARSVAALTAFLNESSRWLHDQQEIFADLDGTAPDPAGPAGTWPHRQQRTSLHAGEGE